MKKIIYLISVILFLFSCEETFTPDTADNFDDYIVEGYIEAGENAAITYVLISKGQPYFGELNIDAYISSFVENAEVKVIHNGEDFPLQKICFKDLTDEQKELLADFIPDNIDLDICIYADIFGSINAEVGQKYDLDIKIGDKKITSSTVIPAAAETGELEFRKISNSNADTLRKFWVEVIDPDPAIDNFFRYQIATNGGPFQATSFSAFNDEVFNGQNFTFEFPNPEPVLPEDSDEFRLFGTYLLGDTVQLKYSSLEEAHFDFWQTLGAAEQNAGGNPFASLIRVNSNIEGGLGIWGGSSVKIYEKIVE